MSEMTAALEAQFGLSPGDLEREMVRARERSERASSPNMLSKSIKMVKTKTILALRATTRATRRGATKVKNSFSFERFMRFSSWAFISLYIAIAAAATLLAAAVMFQISTVVGVVYSLFMAWLWAYLVGAWLLAW